ncbi:MAG: glycoside hydrolase family 3 C-terminal domain-containing protein [Oscillospiraceae bacterium]|nr:glycoside hydrolase family 3 C-terminal domain-containing protein [Oscillospiraceae bacterium]
MNRRWIRLTACLLALLLLAGCGTAAPEKTEPEKEETPAADVPTSEPEEPAQEPEQEPETPQEPEVEPPEEEPVTPEPMDNSAKLVADMLSGMTTRQKIAQMMMPDIRYYGTEEAAVPVTELTEELYAAIRDLGLGGVILFAQNVQTPAQTAALTASLQAANEEGGAPVGLMIAIDQEGGTVTRLTAGTQMPGNMALGAIGSEMDARLAGGVIAEELAALGINLDFAPDVDVNVDPKNPIIGVRSFSDDPELTARLGSSFVAGLHSHMVMAAYKHFPGHGDTETDSHVGLPVLDKTLDELRTCELVPFAAGRQADLFMTAHIRFPNIETETYVSTSTGEEITLPATMSRTLLTDVLRGELGYEGVVITDSMVMGAIRDNFDLVDATVLAVNAGADMILIPVELSMDGGIAKMNDYIDALVGKAEDGTLSAERIDKAVERILKLKLRYGLMSGTGTAPGHAPAEPEATVGSEAHHQTEWDLACRAVTLLKNEGGVLPLTGSGRLVIVCPYASQLNSVQFAMDRLKDEGLVDPDADIHVIDGSSLTPEEAPGIVTDATAVVAISSMYGYDDTAPTGEHGRYAAAMDAIMDTLAEMGGKTPFVVISAGLPYDAARYQGAAALLACYNPRGMAQLPEEGQPVQEYGPNIPAAVYTVFGGSSPTGKLPVSIPTLDDEYAPTDATLYERGFGLTYGG